MRSGLSTIQQTLTPEAASVLTCSIAEAARRNHGQTTPLHVAATFLAAPSGLLRQACIRSHPQSSHPLQCRALELCFSCQQSLSSSSSAATAASASPPFIASLATVSPCPVASLVPGLTSSAAPSRNLYMNPRLQQRKNNNACNVPTSVEGCGDQPRTEDVKRVLDILLRSQKRNPIPVGDCNPDALMREVLRRIQSDDGPSLLRNTRVIPFGKEIATTSPDQSQITIKIRELTSSIESMICGSGRGVILDLGDLKWLVESPAVSAGSGSMQLPKPVVSEVGRAAVEEMGRLLKRFADGGRVWLVGAAASATYLRCQVYHPTMEKDWDLQAVPIAPRSSHPNMFPRPESGGVLGDSVGTSAPAKGLMGMGAAAVASSRPPESTIPSQRTALCPLCLERYELELAKLVAKESDYSTKTEAGQTLLPQWLRGGTESSSAPLQSMEEELLKRWCETCSRLHPNIHRLHLASKLPLAPAPSKTSIVLRPHPPSEPMSTLSRCLSPLQLASNQNRDAAKQPTSPSGSPVKTDLVLGSSKVADSSSDTIHKELLKDFTGCIQDAFSVQQSAKIAGILDIDMFKRLFKGLSEKVSWQQEAASAIATVVMQCKSVNGKRRSGGGGKGDTWLLLVGPDKVGKRKMAGALSELVFGVGPTVINFGRASCTCGNDGESNLRFRGRTSVDRVVEAVRRNPFSVIVLEDVDQADMLLQGKIKQAIERGRLPDSYGREVSLGSVIFVLTSDWLPEELKSSYYPLLKREERILDSAYRGLELEITAGERPGKRRPSWLCEDDQPIKLRTESLVGTNLSLDLNLATGIDSESGEGSWNSSDLTSEREYDKGRLVSKCSTSSLASELVELVDEAVTFKPVDFVTLRRNVVESISVKFTAIMGKGRAIKIDEDAVDRIVGGLWLSGAAFDDWAERVLAPSLRQLKDHPLVGGRVVVARLSTGKEDRVQRSCVKDWLPTTVAVAVDDGHGS
ncbi:hypothetical protein C4D60_Mb03t13000 [Musa balbisiana]|uniref:Clp R domain-containing protein n=1 Tax=Musa balbisiana TaxID=52838 RepID=A0A4S8JBA9_MUSBA|nr:hypothetical protein C4D60_Mb03t13000 [Musa balbisiana]